MMAVALTGIARRLDPGRFTGPIFAKELRVLSRRRRSYILRLVYVVLLTVFAVGAYLSVAEAGGGDPSTIYRMSKAGKTVIGTIAWFQFLGLQLIATVSMSTAISEETRRGTLAALMSTPISTVQIVVGKVLGKLLQMATLAAASLPVLIVVRVFGGVPWDFVLGATCVSLTAVLLAGTTALFFSALVRQAYAAILLSLASGFALHLVLP